MAYYSPSQIKVEQGAGSSPLFGVFDAWDEHLDAEDELGLSTFSFLENLTVVAAVMQTLQ